MGLFSGAKAQINGQKAMRTHISGNELANAGKLPEARAKYREARDLYEAALSGGPQKANIRQGYAILLMRLGEFEKAMALMQDIRLMKDLTENDWFELRLNYSVCLWKLGRLDEAIATAKRAFQLRKCSSIYSTLGMYLAEKAAETGDFEELEAFNRESMEYDDEDAAIVDNMGAMYEAMEKHDTDPAAKAEHRRLAKEYYEKAHAIRPRQIVTMYNLARMYVEDGEMEKARAALEAAENLYFSAVCAVSEPMMDEIKRRAGL